MTPTPIKRSSAPVNFVKGQKGDKGESVTGPIGPQGRDGSPDTGEDIVRKLESLPEDKKLSYNVLKDIPQIGMMIRQAASSSKAGMASRDYALSELTDTPQSYRGHAGEVLLVNPEETGIDFGSPSGNPFGHDEFDATAGQTIFSLSFSYTPGNYRLQVFVNGLLCRLGAGNDYLESSTTQVTFNSGLVLGDQVTFHLN